jgi:ribosome-associated protein
MCSVADILPITRDLSLPLSEVIIRATRSSGPGGQHANTTASRVEASFDVRASRTLTDEQRELLLARQGPIVRAVAQDTRGQATNRELALERLAGRLRAALAVPRARRPTSPTARSRRRRLAAKARQAARKRDRRPPPGED